jgi:hypothetical protein
MNVTNYIHTGVQTAHTSTGSPLLELVHWLQKTMFLSSTTDTQEDKHVRFAQNELTACGFSAFQLERPETKRVIAYLDQRAHIMAAIRGHVSRVGRVILIATDLNIMYLHATPLYSNFKEFSYDNISEAFINRTGYLSRVTVNTPYSTYDIDNVNSQQAERFLAYVESRTNRPYAGRALNLNKEA